MSILRVTLFVLLSALLPLSSSQGNLEWKYGEAWDDYEDCKKPGQSPIALSSATAVKDDAKTKVVFNRDRKQTSMTTYTINTDHNILFGSQDFAETQLLEGVAYKVGVLTFHWGSDASKGSEHSVDGKFFSGEIEIYHYKAGTTPLDAIEKENGVIIVSVLLQEDSDLKEDIKELEDISAIFPRVQKSEDQYFALNFTETKFSLSKLFPSDGQFFRYTGSTSSPPCNKPVERIVFKTPLKVTAKFLAALRTFKFGDGIAMQDNFRAVQDLGDRTVYKSFE